MSWFEKQKLLMLPEHVFRKIRFESKLLEISKALKNFHMEARYNEKLRFLKSCLKVLKKFGDQALDNQSSRNLLRETVKKSCS